jgi:hypothetical protein
LVLSLPSSTPTCKRDELPAESRAVLQTTKDRRAKRLEISDLRFEISNLKSDIADQRRSNSRRQILLTHPTKKRTEDCSVRLSF